MLFENIHDFGEHVDRVGALHLDHLTSAINDAEANDLTAILGPTLYSDLLSAYVASMADTAVELDAKYASLLPKARAVVAPTALAEAAPGLAITVSDGGLQRQENDQRKTLYQYQQADFIDAMRRKADRATDKLYAFLEENIADYDSWSASQQFTSYRSVLIKTGTEFNAIFRSNTPYWLYYSLRPYMLQVQQIDFANILGSTTAQAIITKATAAEPNYTPEETILVDHLRKLLAYKSLVYGLPFINARIDETGVSVVSSSTFSTRDKDSKRGNTPDTNLALLLSRLDAQVQLWVNTITAYMEATASTTVFPDYYAWKHPVTAAQDTTNYVDGEAYFSF
jgi:hypothetical protein